MRKWEDIVKDRLEGYESALPEESFSEFRSLRDGAPAVQAPRRFPLAWVMATVVAAGLAAALLLRAPSSTDEDVRIVPQPQAPVVEVTDYSGSGDPISAAPLVGRSVRPKIARQASLPPHDVVADEDNDDVPASPGTLDTVGPDEKDEKGETVTETPAITVVSPYIPKSVETKSVALKAGIAAGAVAGGGLLAALVTPLTGAGDMVSVGLVNQSEGVIGYIDGNLDQHQPKDIMSGKPSHSIPLRAGVSGRIPISGKLNVTTGLEYSLYSSKFKYTVSGEKKQLVHYLGVPVRLDWTFAGNRWLDVYVGGGLEGDFCLGATLAGERLRKDGFSLSVLGAGGVQVNVTKHAGIYVEPMLSWTLPSDRLVLETYRSNHHFMPSVSAGLRINLGK